MTDIIAFIKQNFKWILIIGSIVGICIIGYIGYSIYKASSCSNGSCSTADHVNGFSDDEHVEYCTMDGHCSGSASSANSNEGFEEKVNHASNTNGNDDDAEPIETYSSIGDSDEQ
jgi:hypothetical protein